MLMSSFTQNLKLQFEFVLDTQHVDHGLTMVKGHIWKGRCYRTGLHGPESWSLMAVKDAT